MYKASYLDCDIAVKKLNRINDAKSEEAFRRECAILKGCRHPHIVNFMGVCKDEVGSSCKCVAMEHVLGPMKASHLDLKWAATDGTCAVVSGRADLPDDRADGHEPDERAAAA